MKKKERETGRNYVFEQVARDKKRNLYSTSNLSNVNFTSLQKIQTPGKIMMNQTMANGFGKNQYSQNSKSEPKTGNNDYAGGIISNTNP